MLRVRFYFLALSILALGGCERESRDFHADEQMSSTPVTTRAIDLDADRKPQMNPGSDAAVASIDTTKFERNGFNLTQGQWLYTQMNCGTCHAAGGGGDIGPTLTDDRWIYGAEPEKIFQSIAGGRPNGMPAYGRRMTQDQIWQLAAFVRSLSGLVPKTIAPGRQDTMQTSQAPNSTNPPPVLRTMPSAGNGGVLR